jgi:hypothetical protein
MSLAHSLLAVLSGASLKQDTLAFKVSHLTQKQRFATLGALFVVAPDLS